MLLACEDWPVCCTMVRFSRLKQRELPEYNEETLTVAHYFFVIKERQGGSEVRLGGL